ncbi:MAG: hypothetical protein ACXADF_17230, partial [Candidatus Thorarchaeota archaeon]
MKKGKSHGRRIIISDDIEDTMITENWVNVVVFVSGNRLANFLERVFSTFKDDPYSHYQVRGKDNRKKVGITL